MDRFLSVPSNIVTDQWLCAHITWDYYKAMVFNFGDRFESPRELIHTIRKLNQVELGLEYWLCVKLPR